MNVLILAQYFPPDMGGGATRAYNVAKGLSLNGCNVFVVAAAPHYPNGEIPAKYRWKPIVIDYIDGMKIIRTFMLPLPSKGLLNRLILFMVFIISSLFALPLIKKVDVIWAANPNILSFFPSIIYGIFKGAPIILNVDDLWPEDLYNFNLVKRDSMIFRIGEILAKIAYHKSRGITPISPGYVNVISKKYGVDVGKIHVVRAGVDIDKFKPKIIEKRNERFCVLYSGAFSMAYDFDQVLLAAKDLEESEEIEFVLQGGGELAGYLKARVEELGLKNVKVINRILRRDEVAKLLSWADALILPLRDFGAPYLGISSKLYEYQAVGKPIICCAEGEPARYVEETRSGIVVKPGDHEALAKAVLHLRENRDVAEELGASGRRNVEKNLSIKKIGLRMMCVFQKVLSNSSTIHKAEQNMAWSFEEAG